MEVDTLVISAGSTKGILALGAIQSAMDEKLLDKLENFIGTSSGSMICYLLIIGYTPIEIMIYLCEKQLLEKLSKFDLISLVRGQGGSTFMYIQEQLEKMTIDKIGYLPTLKDLKDKYGKTLICVTHNFTENKTEYLSYLTYPTLPCITAIHMSSNLPFIFELYKYGNSYYIDGGISDCFAIDIGDNMSQTGVLGIIVDSSHNNTKTDVFNLEMLYKILNIPIYQAMEYKISRVSDKCRIIRLAYGNLKVFSFNLNSKQKLDLFSSGYDQMKETMAVSLVKNV